MRAERVEAVSAGRSVGEVVPAGAVEVLDGAWVSAPAQAMPNVSGARTDGRVVELWLGRSTPSTQRRYAEDLEKFREFMSRKFLAAITLSGQTSPRPPALP